MRAKPPSRSTRANRAVGKTRPKSNDKKIENGNSGSRKPQITDLSVLRQPIDTSVAGLKQACKLFETGTPEMLNILSYECDIVYECKVCRNLFRSLVNFISHKRVYCTKHYSRSQDLLSSDHQIEDHTVIVETNNSLVDRPARVTTRRDLTSIVESVSSKVPASQFYTDAANKVSARNSARKETTVHLQPMENTTFGVFQTVVNSPMKDLMKNQVTELHSMLSEEEEVPTLGPDGRILTNGRVDQKEEKGSKQVLSGLICSKCNMKFSTRKTLTQHVKTIHDCIKTCYSCPCCKNNFANNWSVYRHLYKIHRKTNEQVRKLRTQIQKKEIKVDKNKTGDAQNKVNQCQTEQHRLEQENKAWMEHFEDDFELQRCGGCGRRFERKAALTSHSQICQKRIAACNRIQKEPDSPSKTPPVSIPTTKPAVPKIQSEKKIGIQVRMNYCKVGSSSTTHSEERRRTRFGLGDESDVEAASVDGKYAPSSHSSIKDPTEVRSNSGIDNFLQIHKNMESAGSIDKVKVYLNNVTHSVFKKKDTDIQNNVISNYFPTLGKLEAKCLELRKALEVDTVTLEDTKEKDDWSSSEMEEANIKKTEDDKHKDIPELCDNALSAFDCKSECLIADDVPDEIGVVNDESIKPDLPEQIQLPEADSTSMSSSGSVEIIYEQRGSLNEIKTVIESNDNSVELNDVLNSCDEAEEVSTSVITDENVPTVQNEIIQVNDPTVQNEIIQVNDETSDESGSSKENHLESCLPDIKKQTDSVALGNEFLLENTISILTRNQLRAICKDDVINVDKSIEPQTVTAHTNHSLKASNNENNRSSSWVNRTLLKHIRFRRLQCLICKKRYRSFKPLRDHVAEHAGWKRFRCLSSDCSFSSFSKHSCVTHLLKTHLKPSEKDLASSMVAEISPSEWKLNFNFNKTYPVVGVKSANIRNSARLKTKNIQSNEVHNSLNKIKVEKTSKDIQKPSSENNVCEPITKKRRTKEDNDLVISDDCIPIKGARRSSVSSNLATQTVESALSINLVPNSNQDSFVSTEEEVMSSDTEENKIGEECQDPNSSDLQELVMEVIFGTNNTIANSSLISGRPIRNKMRPKRDSDFIFENHKDSSTSETSNSRNGPIRKSLRIPDLKTDLDPTKKFK